LYTQSGQKEDYSLTLRKVKMLDNRISLFAQAHLPSWQFSPEQSQSRDVFSQQNLGCENDVILRDTYEDPRHAD